MIVLHLGAFALDVDSQRPSFWQRLAPHIRLLCALLFVFATALTPNGRWFTWAVYGVALALLLLISRVTLSILLQRVAVEFTFIGVVLLGTLFRPGGVVLWEWGWLRITSEGLMVLGSVALKALLSLLMLNLLVITTPIPALLQGLAILKLPPLLIAILSSMYRYISVLVDELTAMKRAALSRNLLVKRGWQRQVLGNMIGSLFIRTYERGDRIYQAMLARGYTGFPAAVVGPRLQRRDILAVVILMLVILTGQIAPFV